MKKKLNGTSNFNIIIVDINIWLSWWILISSMLNNICPGYNSTEHVSTVVSPSNNMIEVGPGPLKMSFSSASGQLNRIFNSISGVSIKINLSLLNDLIIFHSRSVDINESKSAVSHRCLLIIFPIKKAHKLSIILWFAVDLTSNYYAFLLVGIRFCCNNTQFQIISRFGFSRGIVFVMHLDNIMSRYMVKLRV